jgi:hypothetical protein
MTISSYPNGFNNGVLIKGLPVELPNSGKVFWVNNSSVLPDNGVSGSDSASNGTYLRPYATIDYAVGQCTAGRGDVIYVMPGHSETITGAAGVDLDVQGIKVIGLGQGSLQPRIDFTNAAATVEVNADDILIQNINFHANVTVVAIGLSVLTGATGTVVNDCVFDVETTATDEFLISINLGVGCDNTTIQNTNIDMGLGGAAHAIKLVGASANVDIRGCRIVGDYSTANIGGITTLSTEVYIEENVLVNGGSGNINAQPVIEMLTGTTGMVRGNTFFCNLATIAAQSVADTMIFSNNFAGEDVGAAAGNILRTAAASVTASADD